MVLLKDKDYVKNKEINQLAARINQFLQEQGVSNELEASAVLECAKISWRDETQMEKIRQGRHLEGEFPDEE